MITILKIATRLLCTIASVIFAVKIGTASSHESEQKRIDACFFWLLYGILIGILMGLQI